MEPFEPGRDVTPFDLAVARARFAAAPESLLAEIGPTTEERAALDQVVFQGDFIPGTPWVPPDSAFYARNLPVPPRDVAKARRLLAEAGQPTPTLRLRER
jgi:ABC-type transport system substrate-binding protein